VDDGLRRQRGGLEERCVAFQEGGTADGEVRQVDDRLAVQIAPRPGPEANRDVDGVAAEVLYTTKGNSVWHPEDLELEEACVRVYNPKRIATSTGSRSKSA